MVENGFKIYGWNIRSLSIIEANGCIRLKECIDSRYINITIYDFVKVLDVMRKEKLICGRNVSRYNYYIRLYSRRGIPLNCHLKVLIESKTKNKFDDWLFAIMYNKLEWDKDCNCSYFLKWLKNAE